MFGIKTHEKHSKNAKDGYLSHVQCQRFYGGRGSLQAPHGRILSAFRGCRRQRCGLPPNQGGVAGDFSYFFPPTRTVLAPRKHRRRSVPATALKAGSQVASAYTISS